MLHWLSSQHIIPFVRSALTWLCSPNVCQWLDKIYASAKTELKEKINMILSTTCEFTVFLLVCMFQCLTLKYVLTNQRMA